MKLPKALIVEDDVDLADVLVDQFTMSGVEAHACHSSVDARKFIAQGDYQVFVIDERLPGDPGHTLLPLVDHKKSSIVFISGDPRLDVVLLYEKNAHVVIRKPVSPMDVVSAAIRHFNGDKALEEKNQKDFHEKMASLTKREHQVLELIRQGLVAGQISEKLKISSETVMKHRASIRRKFDGLKIIQICQNLNK